MPDRRNSLQPIADTLESSSIEDVTEVTAARDRIADRLNRVDSSDSIESLLSHSDVDSGGEDHSRSCNGIRAEGPIVFIGFRIISRNPDFCLAGIGESASKVCLNKAPCLTAAHSRSTKITLSPGFYLRVGSPESSKISIFTEPLGPVELTTIKR